LVKRILERTVDALASAGDERRSKLR